MNHGGAMLTSMRSLLECFASHCTERRTLDELHRLLGDDDLWPEAHALFQRIRAKSLQALAQGDSRLVAQYAFEEACAKTIYNLSKKSAPFDPDSPYWVVPTA